MPPAHASKCRTVMSPARRRVLRTVSGPRPSGKGSKHGTKSSPQERGLPDACRLPGLPGQGGNAFLQKDFTEQLPIESSGRRAL